MFNRIRIHITRGNIFSLAVAVVLMALPGTGWITPIVAKIVVYVSGGIAIIACIVFTIKNERQLREKQIASWEQIVDAKWENIEKLTDLVYSIEEASEDDRIRIWNDITRTRNKLNDNKADKLIQEMIDAINESLQTGMTLHPTIEPAMNNLRDYLNKKYKR